jgi:anti-sigma factor RsiW
MPEPGQSHASTYVCHRPACQADAAEWVREITGVRGQFVPFGPPQQPQQQPALFSLTATPEA